MHREKKGTRAGLVRQLPSTPLRLMNPHNTQMKTAVHLEHAYNFTVLLNWDVTAEPVSFSESFWYREESCCRKMKHWGILTEPIWPSPGRRSWSERMLLYVPFYTSAEIQVDKVSAAFSSTQFYSFSSNTFCWSSPKLKYRDKLQT